MKKNTVLAIVLSSLVIMTSMFIQYKFFPPEASEVKIEKMETVEKDDLEKDTLFDKVALERFIVVGTQTLQEKTYTIETPLVHVVFTNNGGDILSYRLKEYKESSGEDGVEMVKNALSSNRAFSLAFNSTEAPSFDGLFEVKERKTERGKAIAFIANVRSLDDKHSVGDMQKENNGASKLTDSTQLVASKEEFTVASENVEDESGDRADYRIIKEYEFFDNDYMFVLSITIEAGKDKKTIENVFYSLRTQPQIGPDWALGDRYEYRKFSSYSNGTATNVKISEGERKTSADVAQWVAIAGKYFALAIIPEKPIQNVAYSMKSRSDMPLYDSQIFINSPRVQGNKRQDVYRVYIGPNSDKFLSKYNVKKK